MNFLGRLNGATERYKCCGQPLSVIDIGVMSMGTETIIYPIYCCFSCTQCYEDKFDIEIESDILATSVRKLEGIDLQLATFSSPLVYQAIGNIDNALCQTDTNFKRMLTDDWLYRFNQGQAQAQDQLQLQIIELENRLTDMINRTHDDVIEDVRLRVNSFQLQ